MSKPLGIAQTGVDESVVPEDPSELLRFRLTAFLRELFLTVNCTMCVPMYSMLIWMSIYCTLIYFAPTIPIRMVVLSYAVYCVFDETPRLGVRWLSYQQIDWLRRNIFFQLVARYFPVSLHKTQDLDSEQGPYIFLYHPHGIIGMGVNTAMNMNGCHFDKVFPGIKRWAVTLNASFYAPIFREWMICLGIISANKKTLKRKLSQKESIVLVPGGAAEALHAHRSNFKLQILSRKGFVRLALETRAKPIPCLGFGENEAFDTLYVADEEKGSWLWQAQLQLEKILSFSTPFITWPVPNRHPIHVVIGKPLVFPEMKKGLRYEEYVDQCHDSYLEALRELYSDNKAKYGYQDMPLQFV
jgi:hypothetical protein